MENMLLDKNLVFSVERITCNGIFSLVEFDSERRNINSECIGFVVAYSE